MFTYVYCIMHCNWIKWKDPHTTGSVVWENCLSCRNPLLLANILKIQRPSSTFQHIHPSSHRFPLHFPPKKLAIAHWLTLQVRQLLQRQLRKLGWEGSCRIQVWFGCDFWFASLLCFFRQSDGNQEISPPVEAAMMCKNCRPQQHELLLPRPGHYCWKGASMKQVAWSSYFVGLWNMMCLTGVLSGQSHAQCSDGRNMLQWEA